MQIQVRRYNRNTHKKKNRFYVFFSFIRQYLCRLKRGLVPRRKCELPVSTHSSLGAAELCASSCTPTGTGLPRSSCQAACAVFSNSSDRHRAPANCRKGQGLPPGSISWQLLLPSDLSPDLHSSQRPVQEQLCTKPLQQQGCTSTTACETV